MWGYLRRKKQQLKWQIALHQQEMNENKIQFLTNVSHGIAYPSYAYLCSIETIT